MEKTNKMQDIQNKLNEINMEAFITPDFKGNIFIMFTKQNRQTVEELIKELTNKGVKVLKNLDYSDRLTLSGRIKLKVETLKGVQI